MFNWQESEQERRFYEKLRETEDYYERKLNAARSAAREEIHALYEEIAMWEDLARALEDAYANCNGQLTDELKQAIEDIIANIPVDVCDW